MARKQEPVRPYFSVKHEFDASYRAYQNAATMLHRAVRSAVQLGTTPEKAFRCMSILAQAEAEFKSAAYGKE